MRYLIILLFLYGCASKQPLTGGAKDETPPQVVSAIPDSASLSITSPIFKFTFDEYVKTTNVNQLLVISPNQEIPPTLQIKAKTLTVQLNDSLKPNTTYTILFNGSVVDNNEGNPLDDYRYIFSTGDYIDSLNYRGTVTDITTGKPCEDCRVLLYKSLNDSVILQSKPDYITSTSSTGRFEFTNLPPKEFKAYSLRDENKNLLLDDDEFVSMSSIIHTDSTTFDTFIIFPYTRDKSLEIVKAKKSKPGIHRFALNQPIDTDSIEVHLNDTLYPFQFNFSLDTLSIYHHSTDTSQLKIFTSSDTFSFSLYPQNKLGYSPKFTVHHAPTGFFLASDFWITSVDTAGISMIQDSVLLDISLDSTNRHNQYFSAVYHPNLPSKIIINSGALIDALGQAALTDTLNLPAQIEGAPTLKLSIELPDSSHYIVQLKKGDLVVNQQLINKSQQLVYPKMQPGSYSVDLIKDSNGNNNWDSGNPILRIAPELRTRSEVFELRLNWDKDLIIKAL